MDHLQMHTRTLLNADVLLLVFALANKQTKLALMSACKLLYKEGGKQFLKSMRVSLGTEARLRSFLRFMDADGGSRTRFLGQLSLDIENPSGSVTQQLKTTISRLVPLSVLTSLEIEDLEPLLCAHPPLSQAIAKLTSLKDISFSRIGKRGLEMVRSMQSRPDSAFISPRHVAFERLNGGADGDAIMFLQQFSSSLRDLTVAGGGATVDPQDDSPRYPLLSQLLLDDPVSPTTWHYARAFPNLRSLSIAGTDHGHGEAEAAGLVAFRAENVARLRRHGGCWESLDHFDGTLLMLWLLGLPGPVRSLSLCDDQREVSPDMFRDACGAARATRLDFYFYQTALFLKPEITRAFAEGCGATLRKLSITLDVNPDEYSEDRDEDEDEDEDELDLGDVLDGLTDMLRSFSALESVDLWIQFHMDREDEPLPVEEYAQGMDLDALCAALHEAVPSANHVELALRDHRKRGTVTVEIGSQG